VTLKGGSTKYHMNIFAFLKSNFWSKKVLLSSKILVLKDAFLLNNFTIQTCISLNLKVKMSHVRKAPKKLEWPLNDEKHCTLKWVIVVLIKQNILFDSTDIKLCKKIKNLTRICKLGKKKTSLTNFFCKCLFDANFLWPLFCLYIFQAAKIVMTLQKKKWELFGESQFYRAFHRFGQAKFPDADGGSILGSSQFSILHQLPPKRLLDSKVVKINPKIIISIH